MAEFWWKVLCVFTRERDKKVKRMRDGRVERETEFFILFVSLVYIILTSHI